MIAKTPRHAARLAVPGASTATGGGLAAPSRRAVLRGIGGVTLALPFLESLAGRSAGAAAPEVPHPAVFLRQGNGVQQADNGEPDRYWPRSLGAISTQSLSNGDADRAVSELAAFADKLLLVSGTRFYDTSDVFCGHSGGGNQVLTAAQVSTNPSGAGSLSMGESIDNYIARHFSNNGGEPLTLYTGPRYGYLEEVLSYRGPMDLRSAEDDPWTAYLRMVGGDTTDNLLIGRRKSVNDLVRAQMTTLLGRTDLSASDRQRLELHFDSIRDFEVLSCNLSGDEEQAMQDMSGFGTRDENRIACAMLHCDLIAIAFACDFARSATLQIGDGNDATQYTVGGVRLPSYHQISHRIYSDGSEGAPIDGAIDMHHEIDRQMLQVFAHLLEKLDGYGILDNSLAVMTNDLGAGVSHTYNNVPWVIAGKGDGLLKQGQYVDARVGYNTTTHNKLLNTLISATGLRKSNGDLVDDFGDPSLEQGTIDAMIA
ncbi:MAG: DUF1552 domain-containing protein [Myxococcota bacterium]